MHVGQRRWRAVVWTLHALFLEGCAAHLLLRAMVAPRGVPPPALATMPEPSGAADSAVEACRPIQNLLLLPVRAAAALMPGERRTYPIKDGRMRNFFLESAQLGDGCIGQLLQHRGSGKMALTVPVLKITRMSITHVELVCVGRGTIQLPIRSMPIGAHPIATVYPKSDFHLSGYPEALSTARALYHSCHGLANRVKLRPFTSSSSEALVRNLGAISERSEHELA